MIKAANARFTHWVSALELDTDSGICQFSNPNCCEANHQLPSRSPGGKRMNLTTAQLEALQELLHTAVDRAARALEHLINLDVYVEPSAIQVLMPLDISHELVQQFGKVQLSVVGVNFSGLLNGTAQFILPLENTARLLSIVNREHIYAEDLNMLRIGTFVEIASVLINHILESMIDQMHRPLHIFMPTYRQTSAENLLPLADLVGNSMVLLAPMQLDIASLQLVSHLSLVFRIGSFDTFLSRTPV
jgi:chemotaxis protein CheY-P-specific phosphatase CheC